MSIAVRGRSVVVLLLLSGSLGLSPLPGSAQESRPAVDQRVRGQRANGSSFDGLVRSVDETGLGLLLQVGSAPTFIAFAEMAGLEVQRAEYSRGRGAFTGFLIGGGVGAIAGAVIGGSSSDTYVCSGSCGGEGAVLLALGVGLVGLVVGAAIGSTGYRWVPVALP